MSSAGLSVRNRSGGELARRGFIDRKPFVSSTEERKNMKKVWGTHHVHRDGASTDGDARVDPICGMSVTRSNAAATRTDGDVEYFFCSNGCAVAFDTDHAH